MAINLVKGQKVEFHQKKFIADMGWQPNEKPGGPDFDLDASAFLLNDKGKLIKEEHFIFYNNLCGLGHNEDDPCEDHGCTDGDFGVKLMGDLWYEGGGGSEWWNDELFKLNLSKIPSDVYAVSFLLTISTVSDSRQGKQKSLCFGERVSGIII